MRIELLGAATIGTAEERGPIRAKKVRAMLVLLALNAGVAVSYPDMVDELWGDSPLGNARNALQANATRLRRLLEPFAGEPGRPAVLVTAGAGYLLDIPRNAVDANLFLELTDHGTTQIRRDQPERAVETLNQALRLWRGPALTDSVDGPRAKAAAERLEERRLTALEDLMEARLALGHERQVVSELRWLLSQYPARERLSEHLMLALYRCGRQTEAIAVFHQVRKHLADEVGLAPSPSLQKRYQEILVQEPTLGDRSSSG